MPIIKPKNAEFKALEGNTPPLMYPLIDLIGARPGEAGRPARDGRPGRPSKPAQLMTDHLDEVYGRIESYWGSTAILLDPYLFLHRHPNGLQTLVDKIDEWRTSESRVNIIPVLRVTTRPSVTAALSRLTRGNGDRMGIRLTRADIFRSDVKDDIDGLLAITQTSPSLTDVVLDVGSIEEQDMQILVTACVATVRALITENYRSITLVGTGFVANPRDGSERIERQELTLWNIVQSHIDVPIQFGDYGVDAPAAPVDPLFVESNIIMSAVALRYTNSDHWIFLKEISPRVLDPETGRTSVQRGSFRTICERLIANPQFLGSDFSPGDQYIQDMADGRFLNQGSPSAWRQAAFSHHFTFIQLQLQDDDDPGAIDVDDELPF